MSRTIQAISYFFSAILLILPFVYFPKVFNSYELPKLIFLGVSILLLGTIILFREIGVKSLRIRLSKTDLAIAAFLAVLFISDLFGISPKNSFLGSSYRLQGFLTYAVLGYGYMIVRILSMQGKMKINTILIAQIGVLSIVLIIQYILVHTYGEVVSLFQNRYHGTFGNPNFAGGYIAMLFAYILFLRQKEANTFYWMKPIIILLSGIAVVLTDSRSAILAMIVAVVFYYFTVIKKITGWARVGIISAICVVSLSFIFLSIDQALFEKRNSEWENRSVIWKEGMHLFSKRPILGYGQENVQVIFPANLHFSVDNMHNIFLEYALSSGVIGVISFGFLLSIILKASNIVRRMLFVCFVITAFFNPISISQLFLFWVMMGLENNPE